MVYNEITNIKPIVPLSFLLKSLIVVKDYMMTVLFTFCSEKSILSTLDMSSVKCHGLTGYLRARIESELHTT